MSAGGDKTAIVGGASARRAAPSRHVESIALAIQDESQDPEVDEVCASWRRSAQRHHVDPQSAEPPRVLTAGEIRRVREPADRLLSTAHIELDRLFAMVRPAGYAVLLCDTNGVVIEHRSSERRSVDLRYWGVWLGAVWSEAVEGTNGVGTCIEEQRPITVHQSQHFRTRHSSLSCSGAPIYGPDGKLAAVLDLSSIDPHVSAQSHALTLALVTTSAHMIEERLFRERFRKEWIIAVAPPDEEQGAPLLALDRDHRIVGADRIARIQFRISDERLDAGLGLWTIFARQGSLVHRRDRIDNLVHLTMARGSDSACALVSAPVTSPRAPISPLDDLLQPRIPLLSGMPRSLAVPPPRGGLAPSALRRVLDHIDAHLGENMSLEALASRTHLSAYHFARTFKQSVGVSPHRYVLEQRVSKAQELLSRTALPLSSIARTVGFSDQSHFSRCFRRLVGATPSDFRRARQ